MKIQQWTVIWVEDLTRPCRTKIFEDANELGKFIADLLKQGKQTVTAFENFTAQTP